MAIPSGTPTGAPSRPPTAALTSAPTALPTQCTATWGDCGGGGEGYDAGDCLTSTNASYLRHCQEDTSPCCDPDALCYWKNSGYAQARGSIAFRIQNADCSEASSPRFVSLSKSPNSTAKNDPPCACAVPPIVPRRRRVGVFGPDVHAVVEPNGAADERADRHAKRGADAGADAVRRLCVCVFDLVSHLAWHLAPR